MGRRSMDELLTAFDPLHSSNGGASSATAIPQANSSPLFPEPTASTTPASSAKSSEIQHIATARHHAPISLSQAPLDLLSFDEHNDESTSHASNSASLNGPHNIISSHTGGQIVSQSAAFPSVQAKAAQRQENLLQELHNADQPFNTHIGGAPSNQGIAASPPTGPTPRQRRPSSGFSPPRRMSRSGLMHDEHIPQIRAQHAHTTSSGQHSPTMEILGHVPASPSTRVSDEPAVLFHPSSPPSGSTIDSLRQNSYFPNVGRPGGSGIPPPPPPAQSIFDRPVATSDRQRRTSSSDRQAFHTLNDGTSSSGQSVNSAPSAQPESRKPSGGRAAFIQNALRGPPPPFSSPSLKQSTSSHPQPIAGPSQAPGPIPVPHSNSPSQSAPPPSSPGSKPKSFRKPTFDFPSFSTLGSSVSSSGRSQTLPQPAVHIKDERRSGSNTPSPASSLIIDSDPLPPLVLKVTGAARDSKRVLTEDIADGIRMALPPRIKLCKSWTLLYSLDAHGTSLTTLYTRVQAGLQKSTGGCVLVVQDMDGGIFGAYVNEAFRKSESYYGNGECFLWKVESFPPGDNFRVGPIVRPFRWTARNDYIILSDSGFLSVGGGDGKFGLWLDSSFDKGFTTSCPAFANEPLCSPSLIRNGVDGNPEEIAHKDFSVTGAHL